MVSYYLIIFIIHMYLYLYTWFSVSSVFLMCTRVLGLTAWNWINYQVVLGEEWFTCSQQPLIASSSSARLGTLWFPSIQVCLSNWKMSSWFWRLGSKTAWCWHLAEVIPWRHSMWTVFLKAVWLCFHV